MYRTIVRTAVADILRNAAHSVDLGGVDWFAIFAAKVSHDHFDWLADEIMANGFTVPIVIEDGGEGNWTICNGHHRLCAAILLGLDEIPVIFASAWDWIDDSHDGNHELPPGSFDYWTMLRDNVEGTHWGDTSAQAWRRQYAGEEYGEDEDEADRCDMCGDCACCCNCGAVVECDECGALIDDEGNNEHRIPCRERDTDVIRCDESLQWHYRHTACEHMRAGDWSEALAEHAYRGNLPIGAWVPAFVVEMAYADHAEWVRDAALRAAHARYVSEVDGMRAMCQAEWRASTGALARQAGRVVEARDAYFAL